MNRQASSKLKFDIHQPIKITKQQASYQTLLLDMMSKFYNQQKIFVEQQKITNKLLKRLVGEDDELEGLEDSSSHSHLSNFIGERSDSNFIIQKRVPERMVTAQGHFYTKDPSEFDNPNQIKSVANYSQHQQGVQPKVKNHQLNQIKKQTNVCTSRQLQQIAQILLRVEKTLLNKEGNQSKLLKLTLQSSLQIKEMIETHRGDDNLGILSKKTLVSENKQMDNYLTKFLKNKFASEHQMEKKSLGPKKNYHVLSQIQKYSDRRELKIKIPIEQIVESSGEKIDLKASIEEWLGIVYRATASICWHMLSNYLLNFEEVKILFTENIVYNFIQCMQALKEKGYGDERDRMAQVINKTSMKILSFLCKQYPLTKIDSPNLALREKIELINDKGNAEFDLIGQLSAHDDNISFALREDRNYTSLIMKCINHMISRTKEQYGHFQKTMNSQFQEIFFKNKRQRKEEEDENRKFFTTEDQKYYQQVKSYTKILIGCKINKNTELYTQHQISNEIFYVKSMSILRIITKWLEAVQEIYQNPKKEIKQTTNQFKDNQGNYLYLYQQVKNQLYSKIKQNRKFLEEKLQNIQKECYKMEVLLSEKQFTTDSSHYHLSVEQTSVGRYCINLKSAISSYICSELSEVIHFLLEIPTKINIDKLGLDNKRDRKLVKDDIKRLNLIQLKLFDLLRCKCISKQSEIIYLLDRIYQRHNDINDPFRIVRIKDRLNTTTRDILLNVQLEKKGLVCQIQLAVVGNIDKKQELLDQYSHFLYELERAELGPLSQNACIWGAHDQKAIFFQNLKRQENSIFQTHKSHECVKRYEMEDFTNLNNYFETFLRPLICESCSKFFEIPRTCLQNVLCKLCNKTYCGECQLAALSQVSKVMRKKFIFESNKLNNFLKYITEYTDFDQPFPKKGFIIKKFNLKKQLIFYKIVEKHIDYNEKDCQNSDDFQKRYRLQMINTVLLLDKKKIVSKILNKQPIIAVERDKKYYLQQIVKEGNNDKKRQLQSFFIYAFDESRSDKLKLAMGSWNEIIGKCQNHMKVMNLIYDTNYISDLKFIKMAVKEIEKINKENDYQLSSQEISYIISGEKIILIEIVIDQMIMRASLQKKKNLNKLAEMAKKKNVFVEMQFSGFTDELSEQVLAPEVKNEQMLKQFYKHIEKLNLNFCQVSKINFVRPMISLNILSLKKNLLTSIEGVEKLTNLTSIRFSQNNVSSLEPLQNLIKLTYLTATKNQIISMKGVQNLINLESLCLADNFILKIEYLNKIDLKTLQLTGNKNLQILQGISQMKRLKRITCGRTKIKDVSQLSQFDPESMLMESLSLEFLDLNIIPTIINHLTYLVEIDLESCHLKSLTNLSNLKKLREIDASKNYIESMGELEHNIALEFIKLDDNLIEDICGIGPLVMLRKLSLRKNPLKTFTDLNKLEYHISIYYTSSQELESKKCTAEFEKNFFDWKDFKGTLSASSSDENN